MADAWVVPRWRAEKVKGTGRKSNRLPRSTLTARRLSLDARLQGEKRNPPLRRLFLVSSSSQSSSSAFFFFSGRPGWRPGLATGFGAVFLGVLVGFCFHGRRNGCGGCG